MAFAAAVFATAAPALAQPAGPSFDCAKAQAPDEIAICGDARLAELDQAASIAFSQAAAKDRQQAREIARAAFAARRGCRDDKLCILDQQANAIGQYADAGSQVPLPPWTASYRLQLFRARGGTGPGLRRSAGAR